MSDDNTKAIQDYFQENGYVVIKNFLDQSTATLLYHYCCNKVKKVDFLTTWAKHEYREDWDGVFGDKQAPNSYSCYADDMMDTVLASSTQTISTYTGIDLIPTYSYWRFYQLGEELVKHRDRESCEISVTLSIGHNYENTNDNYSWPMFIQDPSEKEEGIPVVLEPGDIIIYRGCEVFHWREKFEGNNHAQVFLHYNEKNGEFNTFLDGRPLLCVPKKYQTG